MARGVNCSFLSCKYIFDVSSEVIVYVVSCNQGSFSICCSKYPFAGTSPSIYNYYTCKQSYKTLQEMILLGYKGNNNIIIPEQSFYSSTKCTSILFIIQYTINCRNKSICSNYSQYQYTCNPKLITVQGVVACIILVPYHIIHPETKF